MTRDAETFERIAVRTGERSGCLVAVAVHSTRLGPALGGARMWTTRIPTQPLTTPVAWPPR